MPKSKSKPDFVDPVDIRNTIEYKEIIELIDQFSHNKENLKSVLEDIVKVANKKIFNIGI